MKYKDFLLQEVFDSKVKWKWTSKRPTEWIAKFTVGDITYEASIFRRKYMGMEDMYELTFSIDERKDKEIKLATGMIVRRGETDPEGITGTGHAGTVFGTVINLVKEFLKHFKKKKDFRGIFFAAKEKSRIKLYNTMTKKLASKNKLHINKTQSDFANGRYWLDKSKKFEKDDTDTAKRNNAALKSIGLDFGSLF